MLEMVKTLLGLGADLIATAVGIILSIMSASFELLVVLHNDMPRVEGMLVGLGIYWVMLNRDKYKALKIISSPVKLLADIIKLAFDQSKEAVLDIFGVVRKSFALAKRKSFGMAKGAWDGLISMLKSLRDKLSK